MLLGLTTACASTGAPPDAALDAAVASAARELSVELAERRPGDGLKLAVVPSGSPSQRFAGLERDIRLRVSDHLRAVAPGLVLIERDDLPALWGEHRLSATGLLDLQATAELGRALGVDALLLGVLVELEQGAQLHLRIVDVETTEQLALVTRSLAIGGAWPEGTAGHAEAPADGPGHSQRAPGGTAAAGDEAATATAKSPAGGEPPPPAAPSVPGRRVVGDFHLALAGCGFVGDQVVCRLAIENLAPGRRTLTVLGETRVHDTDGEDYRLQRVRLGTVVREVRALADAVALELPGALEATLELTFSGVPRRKRKLQKVDLGFAEGPCDFRDVALSRD
ncbi:MAG TPA: hypothetical protein VF100_02200 [Thermoanaerobaculia bacterium]